MKKLNLTNEVFGKLSVLSEAGKYADGHIMWLCLCECGKTPMLPSNSIKRAKSCGCSIIESNKTNKKTHGHTVNAKSSRTYNTWQSMIKRCNYANHKSFSDYGGRGISVCEEWKSFDAFLGDMGERPEGMTLDRIDNYGNYEAANCRWATYKEQRANQRKKGKEDD